MGAEGTMAGVGREVAKEENEKLTGKRERGLLKTSQCITQMSGFIASFLALPGLRTLQPEMSLRLSCLITCCLLTPSLQGACLNLPLGPQGTRKQKTSPSPSWPCPLGLEGGAPLAIQLKASLGALCDPSKQAGQGKWTHVV